MHRPDRLAPWLPLVVPLLVMPACSSRAPASTPPSTPPSASTCAAHCPEPAVDLPAPTLRGTIGGRPFVARSAVMSVTNAEARQGETRLSVSRLFVYEHEASCADLPADQPAWLPTGMGPGEHAIELFIAARWPVFEGSRWAMNDPEPTHDQIDAAFYRQGHHGGALALGTVSFPVAHDDYGVLSVDLHSMNMNLETSGSVRGDVPFIVCR